MVHIFVLVAPGLASRWLLLHSLRTTCVSHLGLGALGSLAGGLGLQLSFLLLDVGSMLFDLVLDSGHVVAAAANRG